jgi:hypothetical protein
MIYVYINKPNLHIEIHRNPECKHIHSHSTLEKQRELKLSIENCSEILHNFSVGNYRFDNKPVTRDMWLVIDFGDLDFEIAIASYIHLLVGRKYRSLAKNPPKFCC